MKDLIDLLIEVHCKLPLEDYISTDVVFFVFILINKVCSVNFGVILHILYCTRTGSLMLKMFRYEKSYN